MKCPMKCPRCNKIHFDLPLDVEKELDIAGKEISDHIDREVLRSTENY